uniref:Jacalin-type lectin domain-containing protein n=1 Tax=Lactuca sativa TaxID=4236 RepID=A0A9R1UFT1_LACSA|nr:hypothetical protein LSAT_V11C900473400 [Lactuca sativa]
METSATYVWGTPWGGKGGENVWQFIIPDGGSLAGLTISSGDVITFADGEFLIGISGRVGFINNLTVITSLSFETNKYTYGPYGTNPGTDFSFGVTNGKFSGFYGRCGLYVDSLGVILQPKT